MDPNAHRVISQYDLPPIQSINFLGSAGGFSGAQLWKLATSQGEFCLRRWPLSHPNEQRLNWIHRVLVHVDRSGCPVVAAPLANQAGETVTRVHQELWEISRWMPGAADFLQHPSDQRIASMMRVLALFHLASAQINQDFHRSTGVNDRLEQLSRVDQTLAALRRAPAGSGDHTFESFRQFVMTAVGPLANSLRANLKQFVNISLPVQPVIRDIWHDHIFFVGDEVTGLVDFGAMQIDNVSLDISRLLGSTIGGDQKKWDFAIAAYDEIRQLSAHELALLPLLDQSGVVLGSLNWLKWTCLENRQFEDWPGVMKRIDFLNARLRGLIG